MPTTTPKEYHDKEFANRLSFFRKEHIDKSQNQASKMLGIAQSNLSYMESGRMAIRLEFISKLVKEYGLNQDWLTTGKGDPVGREKKKQTLLTDITSLNTELSILKKQIRMIEANHNYMLKLIGEQAETIKKLEGKLR